MVNELTAVLPVWRVLLVADGDAREFYRHLGFDAFGNVMAPFDHTKLFEAS